MVVACSVCCVWLLHVLSLMCLVVAGSEFDVSGCCMF